MFRLVKAGLSLLFGGNSKADSAKTFAQTAVEGVGSWIDEQNYTPEEKAKALAEAATTHLKLIEATANENSSRSITRRVMAWAIVGFSVVWASVGMLFAIFNRPDTVQRMVEVAEAFNLGIAFVTVVGFYFGVSLLRK